MEYTLRSLGSFSEMKYGKMPNKKMSFSTSVGIIVLSATEREIYHFVGMKCNSSKIA